MTFENKEASNYQMEAPFFKKEMNNSNEKPLASFDDKGKSITFAGDLKESYAILNTRTGK